MVQTKTQGNHRAYPKELALYVERILLEETDAGLGRGLSQTNVRCRWECGLVNRCTNERFQMLCPGEMVELSSYLISIIQ